MYELLCLTPILAYLDCPQTASRFILNSDVSDQAIGEVLSWVSSDGKERVIAHGSQILHKSETLVYSVQKDARSRLFVRCFRHYLLGCMFVIRTDHEALAREQNFRDHERRIALQQECLEKYDYECIHMPGKQYENEDALSHRAGKLHGNCPSCVTTMTNTIGLKIVADERAHIPTTSSETSLVHNALKNQSPWSSSGEIQGGSWEGGCL